MILKQESNLPVQRHLVLALLRTFWEMLYYINKPGKADNDPLQEFMAVYANGLDSVCVCVH